MIAMTIIYLETRAFQPSAARSNTLSAKSRRLVMPPLNPCVPDTRPPRHPLPSKTRT
ncbi:hypothetical protein BDBG_17520 [Blastomyces gilchristii SLH14081]|uniref:Uncharacterized protein n=1 Tax=Blastomyces gilchristii (strain SLH14081) TaxID=559298 RepID=A0A179UUB5_BLAGS|nr:uncharacterized protein BDBG_17520 [Blastomyces gilchristii SLH14081]OAT11430.1 hypothetical protein BDBG_17520 [Blastomyces gilchristii SLH14081]